MLLEEKVRSCYIYHHGMFTALSVFVCLLSLQGSLRPEEALQSLTIYEGKFGRLKDDREKCAKAKEALELTDTGLLSSSEERVQVMMFRDIVHFIAQMLRELTLLFTICEPGAIHCMGTLFDMRTLHKHGLS